MNKSKIGDIFAVKLKRKDVYFAAQIAGDGTIALVLDGFTREPPSLSEALSFKPFYINHHFWKRGLFYLSADEILDASPVFIGAAAPVCEAQECASVQSIEQICMQLAWNELPKDIRAKFKSAPKRKLEISQPQSEEFYANLARENPFCYEIKSAVWDESLKTFLEATPMLIQLELSGESESVDISQTRLQELALDADGVRQITLNGLLWRLAISGDVSGLQSVRCPFDGELLSLQLNLNGGEFCIRGLEKLRELRIFGKRGVCVDLESVAAIFPNLREIFINGGGGTLKNIETLAKFGQLRSVWLSDIYGFESFPARAQLPRLERLWLWSAPKTACEAAKKQFKGLEDLEIRQARSEAWLAANLDNPLACWDGRGDVSAATAKKAMKAYADAHKKLSELAAKFAHAKPSVAETTDKTQAEKSRSKTLNARASDKTAAQAGKNAEQKCGRAKSQTAQAKSKTANATGEIATTETATAKADAESVATQSAGAALKNARNAAQKESAKAMTDETAAQTAGADDTTASAQMRNLASEPRAAQVQILKDFIAVFNAIDAKRGLDTMQCEEVWDAFCKLCELVPLRAKDQDQIWERNAEF